MTDRKDELIRAINRETSVDLLRQWVFGLSLICDEYEKGRERLKKEIAALNDRIEGLEKANENLQCELARQGSCGE